MSQLERQTSSLSTLTIDDDDEEAYDMTPGKDGNVGFCLVFNTVTFKTNCLPTRNGSDKDVEKIRSTFESFGFKVEEQRDKSVEDIEAIVQKTAATMEPTYKCLIVFFLSHGLGSEYLCDVNGHPVNIKELSKGFDGEHCKELRGKPKLFFAQMCRGVDRDEYLKSGGMYDRAPNDNPAYAVVPEVVPVFQDILISYATCAGQMARLDPKEGSDYIRVLTEVLNTKGTKDDINSILRQVRKNIKQLHPKGSEYYVCPQEDSTLAMKLVFRRV